MLNELYIKRIYNPINLEINIVISKDYLNMKCKYIKMMNGVKFDPNKNTQKIFQDQDQ